MFIRKGDERLQRAGEFGQLELGDVHREPAGPADRGRVETLLVLGVDDEQDRQSVLERDIGQLGGTDVNQGQVAAAKGALKARRGRSLARRN